MSDVTWKPRVLVACAAMAISPAIPGCSPAPAAKAPEKKAEVHSNEADLATVKLSEAQEAKLGLATAEVEFKAMPRTATYGGDVTVPAGRAILVAAPLSGTLGLANGASAVVVGASVKKGQPIYTLTPLLAPDAMANYNNQLVDVRGQAGEARKALDGAKVTLDRVEKLARSRDTSPGNLEDAKNQVAIAEETLKRAESRREALEKTVNALGSGGLIEPLQIVAESAGILRNVSALPGQQVAAGAALFEVVDLDPIWVRVPVYVGDLPRVDASQDASVGGLTESPGSPKVAARPVSAPPSADPLAATADLFYEVPNPSGSLRPGERVGVTIPLKGTAESLVVPRTAIIRDYYGGAWVYEMTAPHVYVRRRVVVDRVVGPSAVLAAGPKAGSKVVTDGAAEVAGTDFGFSK